MVQTIPIRWEQGMAPKRKEPVVPANKSNPANQERRIQQTLKPVFKRLDATRAWLLQLLDDLPVTPIQNKLYDYQVSLPRLEGIVQEIARHLSFGVAVKDAAVGAYTEGIGLASTNLSGLSEDYARPITRILASEPYLRRTSLLGARVMEEMKGFSGETGRDLARILMEAAQDGRNPRDVRKDIMLAFGESKARAERIARTEINGALRRGRLDEAQDTTERLGIKTGMLWASALSPTTRASHSRRHGKVYSVEEIKDFYGRDGNAINCKCAQTEILLNDDGTPLSSGAIKKMTARREAYEAQQKAESQ